MSIKLFKQIIDEIRPSNVNLSGLGEPLLHPNIFEMIKYAKRKGSVVNVPTNLTLPKKVMVKLVESQIDQLKISLDASTPETYTKIRRKDWFNRVVENIEEINLIKRERKLKKPDLRINFALQSLNVDEIDKLFVLAMKKNIKTIYIQWLTYDRVPLEKPLLTNNISKDKLKETISVVKKLSKEKGIETTIQFWERDQDILHQRMNSEGYENKRQCYFPWISTFIDVDGDVKLCPKFVWNRNEGTTGNIVENKFVKIWNSKSYQKARIEFRKKEQKFKSCEHCVPLTVFDAQKVFNKFIIGRI